MPFTRLPCVRGTDPEKVSVAAEVRELAVDVVAGTVDARGLAWQVCVDAGDGGWARVADLAEANASRRGERHPGQQSRMLMCRAAGRSHASLS